MKITKVLLNLVLLFNLFYMTQAFANDFNLGLDESQNSDNGIITEDEENTGGFLLIDESDKDQERKIFANHITIGLGNANSDSFKFGEYSGIENEGSFFIGDLSVLSRGIFDKDDTDYLALTGKELGLESRSASIEYGKQGAYSISFIHDQIEHYIYDDAFTPFHETSENNLVLPDDWGGGTFSDEMTNLMPALNDLNIHTDRVKDGGGFSWIIKENLKFKANYHHENKEGTSSMGGAFGTFSGNPRGTMLPVELDQNSDEFNLRLLYEGKRTQAEISYNYSVFTNKQKYLTWENPFLNPRNPFPWDDSADFDAGGQGRLGLDPDNKAYQLNIAVGYDLGLKTRISGNFSFGRMLQDDDYLPYTVNPNLAAPIQLPDNDLDGKINMWHAGFVFTTSHFDKLGLSAKYTFNDQDNDTPRRTYFYVPDDSGPQGRRLSDNARVNRPYSNQQHKFAVDADYKLFPNTKLGIGYDFDLKNRTYTAMDQNIEHTARAKLSLRPFDFMNLRLGYTHQIKDGSSYKSNEPYLETLIPAFISTLAPNVRFEEDPMLRKFHFADRNHDELSLSISFMPYKSLIVGVNSSLAIDDYNKTDLGLTDFKSFSVSLETSYSINDSLSLYGFFSHDYLNYEQDGYQHSARSGPFPPKSLRDPMNFWNIDNKDSINSVGFGLEWIAIKDNLDITFDYEYTKATTNSVIGGGNTLDFTSIPDQKTRSHSIRLGTRYHLAENITFNMGYFLEQYKVADFAQDDVDPNTNPFLITFGESSQDYTEHVGEVGLTYQF